MIPILIKPFSTEDNETGNPGHVLLAMVEYLMRNPNFTPDMICLNE